MLNDSRRAGLLRLRHLREATEARAEELAESAARFTRLADPSAAPAVVSSFNLFQTPTPLAARLAGLFQTFGDTLEPSAGLGQLYRAVRGVSDCPITLVDISPECCRELYRATEADKAARLVTGDFLQMDGERLGMFDSVIMNPPFKAGADIRHIEHARRFLKPGGRLVAICADGPRQRERLEPIASDWIDLEPGSFAESGTKVNAAIVIFDAD
jgi:SAM-dependent methyltransferase